jgi:hypothetical protein
MRFSAVLILICALSISIYAQRPRTIDPAKDDSAQSTPTPAPAPPTFKAKYEGGVIGYTKKQDGTLSFDDTNSRLVFRNKYQKEVLFIPYGAISAAYPDTQSRRPTAATVIGSVPAPYGLNFPAWFVRKKYRYLTLHFNDVDTNVNGLTSFKVANKELLASVLNTLANKADLTQRGDGYVRKKATAQTTAPGP